MPFFTKVFKRDHSSKKEPRSAQTAPPPKQQWSDTWLRTRVDPEEVAELLLGCTKELKSRALDIPFLLLPFRPTSDPGAARTFIRNYFNPPADRGQLRGAYLLHELRLIEPMVLVSVVKWCWSRLPGGVVTWESYELFKVGERDSHLARDAFTTLMPLSVASHARVQIIFDFFDLVTAIAAHAKINGLTGRKLSRYIGWWAFDHQDTGTGFDTGYRSWAKAADAASHLFFAYLRSLSSGSARGRTGILGLPTSLQQLVEATEYPPETPILMSNETTKIVMEVDAVSPTPYALLRRAKNFQHRTPDSTLHHFASYNDPVQALTDECRRVLWCISSTNQSTGPPSKSLTNLRDASWSRFKDIGFAGHEEGDGSLVGGLKGTGGQSPKPSAEFPNVDVVRPTTPSWADFLSSGFSDDSHVQEQATRLVPPDKVLPPIDTTPRSHKKDKESISGLEPAEIASIAQLDVDDSFWWVWISSLAAEESISRKGVFGRCALIEITFSRGKWMVLEEQVKGAVPEPIHDSDTMKKRTFLGFSSKRGRLLRRRSADGKSPSHSEPYQHPQVDITSRIHVDSDLQARIQAAAAELHRKNKEEEEVPVGVRRGRFEDGVSTKTNSAVTLQPVIVNEASPAMKWAKQYDKTAIRAKYLGDDYAGKGGSSEMLALPTPGMHPNGSQVSMASGRKDKMLPSLPSKDTLILNSPSPSPTPMTTPPPQQVMPVERMEESAAKQAAQAPLPAASPEPGRPSSDSPGQHSIPTVDVEPPQDSVVLPPEHRKPEKRMTGLGIRSMFGSKRHKELPARPMLHSQISSDSAIVVGRASLDAWGNRRVESNPPALRQSITSRFDLLRPSMNHNLEADATSSGRATPDIPEDDIPRPRQSISGRFNLLRKPSAIITNGRATPEIPEDNAPRTRQSSSGRFNLLRKTSGLGTTSVVRQSFVSQLNVPSSEPPQATNPQSTSAQSTDSQSTAQHSVVRGTPQRSETPPMLEEEPDSPVAEDEPVTPVVEQSVPVAVLPPEGPPSTHEDKDLDELSHAPADEHQHGGEEYSTVEKVPLGDHPAMKPATSPMPGEYMTPPEELPENPFSVHDAVTTEPAENSGSLELIRQISPQDRWAQIRRNATERAKQNAEQRPGSAQRTDDGESILEETIEARVARIKARVAELTGNMTTSR